MPCHKGVEISVISQWELSIHPEFAHPDSSQFKRSPDLDQRESLLPAAAVASESKADQLLGRQSAVSVYIPSLSGTRFWLRYRVLEPERTLCHLWYFKFYMNGRHITSWGINTNTTSGGQVMRALFDPSARWNYKDKGVLFKNNGTEARPFFFNNEAEARSAASDGGLLEVRVFRAKGRKRRVAEPEEFKAQDRYGITMPTGGLLEKPQDAKFYDYFLIDPKDNPYATVRFHYRTWDHLEALQLLPTDHPRTLIPTTPSLMSMNGQSRSLQDVDDQDWETIADVISPSVISPSKASPSSNKSSPSHTAWLTDVFDDSPKLTDANIEKNISSPTAPDSPLMLGMHRSRSRQASQESKRRIPVSKFSEVVDDNFVSEQQTRSWIERLGRPLPEIPARSTSLPKDSSECPSPPDSHSRKSSAASHAPSIAHSLLGYADRESSYSPEPVLGIASAVPIVRSPSEEIMGTLSSPRPDEDQYTRQKLPSNSDKSENIRVTGSPREALILTPNVTIRKHRRGPNTPTSPSKGRSIHDDDNSTIVSLTESEWMCRTPSPVKNEPNHVRLSKLWSPGVDKHKSSTPRQGSALRKKALDWYDGDTSPDPEIGNTSPNFRFDDSNEVKIRSGNWI